MLPVHAETQPVHVERASPLPVGHAQLREDSLLHSRLWHIASHSPPAVFVIVTPGILSLLPSGRGAPPPVDNAAAEFEGPLLLGPREHLLHLGREAPRIVLRVGAIEFLGVGILEIIRSRRCHTLPARLSSV